MIMDGSLGFHNIALPRQPPQSPGVFLLPALAETDKNPAQQSESNAEQEEFRIRGRQKLSELAAKVKRTIERLRVTTAHEITRSIIGEEFEKENQAEVRKVKRRIYDTINVFTAVGEIVKSKKRILQNPRQEGKRGVR